MDQTEALFKPHDRLSTSEIFQDYDAASNLLTKVKEVPEELAQIAPKPVDTIIALDVGQNATRHYFYPHNTYSLYSNPSFDGMSTPLLHAWTSINILSLPLDLYLGITTHAHAVPWSYALQ